MIAAKGRAPTTISSYAEESSLPYSLLRTGRWFITKTIVNIALATAIVGTVACTISCLHCLLLLLLLMLLFYNRLLLQFLFTTYYCYCLLWLLFDHTIRSHVIVTGAIILHIMIAFCQIRSATLCSCPGTLHPKPYSLLPKTLNPKPKTLNLKP